MSDAPIVILCTVPSVEVGETLARSLVEARLAACVNIVPGVTSIYRWKAETQIDREAQLVIKTIAARFDATRDHILANHPYETPEILALPTQTGSDAYLAWLRGEVS